jgi:eukaryotic translation initiation factor 2C
MISALNLVLQRHPTRAGAIRVGKNRFFFPSKADTHPLGLGVEAWKGFYTSVRPSFSQLLVNVNVCMTAFYTPGNLAEAMIQFNRQSKGGMPRDFKSGLKVTTTHLGYKKRKPLRAITSKSARDTTFDCEELGGKVSVEHYFLKSSFPISICFCEMVM